MILEKCVRLFTKLSRPRATRSLVKWCFASCYDFLVAIYSINLKRKIDHVFGPEGIVFDQEKVVVCCLVKDGEEYLESFLDHYLSTLQADHVVLLDNGSRDRTAEIARKYSRVSLYRTTLDFRIYKNVIRRFMVENFSNGGWVLAVDIDEFFDFPHSDRISLHGLIGYLNANAYTAATAYLLDMIPNDGKLFSANPGREFHPSDFALYDVSFVKTENYDDYVTMVNNRVSNTAIESRSGGVRREIFGIDPKLLKHPLVFYDKKIKTFYGSHGIGNAHVADVSSVLYHYKFTPRFPEKIDAAIRARSYYQDSAEYRAYKEKQGSLDHGGLLSRGISRLASIDDLLQNGFLQVTSAYEDWVALRAK